MLLYINGKFISFVVFMSGNEADLAFYVSP